MTPDLKELERLARAAIARSDPDEESWYLSDDMRKGHIPLLEDREYVAAANPAAILSLIAELTRPETTLVSIMRAELEQAKKDAARYQWLRKSHHDDDSAIGVTREHMNGWGRVVGKSLRNSDLDKAIDEAIAAGQKFIKENGK